MALEMAEIRVPRLKFLDDMELNPAFFQKAWLANMVQPVVVIDPTTGKATFELETMVTVKENVEPRPLSSLSRSGKIVFVDNFEEYTAALTEKWKVNTGTPTIDTAFPFRGKNCAKIVTGAVATNTADMEKWMPYLGRSKVGFEFWFRCANGVANVTRIEIDYTMYDGSLVTYGNLKWLGQANKKWQYMTPAAAWVDVPNGAQDIYIESTNQPYYHHVKAHFDLQLVQYGKLIVDNQEMNLAGLALRTGASAAAPASIYSVLIETADANAKTLMVDDAVLTIDEP